MSNAAARAMGLTPDDVEVRLPHELKMKSKQAAGGGGDRQAEVRLPRETKVKNKQAADKQVGWVARQH